MVEQQRGQGKIGNLFDTGSWTLIGLRIRVRVLEESRVVTRMVREDKGAKARREEDDEMCSLENGARRQSIPVAQLVSTRKPSRVGGNDARENIPVKNGQQLFEVQD